MGDTTCKLTNEELCSAVEGWVMRLCASGGRDWVIRVPVDFERDPDMLISELVKRFRAAQPADAHPDTAQLRQPEIPAGMVKCGECDGTGRHSGGCNECMCCDGRGYYRA